MKCPPNGGRATAVSWSLAAAWFLLAAVIWAAVPFGPVSSASASTQIARDKITPVFAEDRAAPPTISSGAAIVVDMDTGQIVFSHNANARLPMASTTKIMTAVIVLESLPLDKKVTISGEAHATGGSALGLQRGEVLSVEQLLYCLLVPSANDAAVALAQATAGSVKEFVKMMNAKAKTLGLSNTHFVNPSGLHDEKHFSSAKDLATLTQHAMQDPVFRRIVRTRSYDLPRPGQDAPRKLKNHNALLAANSWVTGVKTGSTPYADYCLVASGSKDGVSLVSVLLGAADDETRWEESQALLDYGFTRFTRTVLADQGRLVAELDVPNSLGKQIRLVEGQTLVTSLFEEDVVTCTATLEREPELPVQIGDVYGTVEFGLDGEGIGSVDLIAAQPIEQVTLEMLLSALREPWTPGLRLDGLLRTASTG
jgi:D-alanyl-D-alanine carboxypeptidase (penicillin-binding protein 5/6)